MTRNSISSIAHLWDMDGIEIHPLYDDCRADNTVTIRICEGFTILPTESGLRAFVAKAQAYLDKLDNSQPSVEYRGPRAIPDDEPF